MSLSFRLQLSRLKTLAWRKPIEEAARLRRWGARAYFRCAAWEREMALAVEELPVAEPRRGGTLEVCYLTGRRFWHQTAFCAWTLACHSGRRVVLHLVDDGSLEVGHVAGLRRLFPEGRTLRKDEVEARLEAMLPLARFPELRARWLDYVNIRKLIDIHLDSRGAKLVLDSDMLFFDNPGELLGWWDLPEPDRPMCLMTDCVESYGYSRPLMERLCGARIPAKLNVGICGLRSEDLDWDELESWCQSLREAEGHSYFLEQALVAMLAARGQAQVMPAERYITYPTRQQVAEGNGVLQHYVADSKPWYFGEAWKVAMGAAGLARP